MTLASQPLETLSQFNPRQPAVRTIAVSYFMNSLDQYSFGLRRDIQAQIPCEIGTFNDETDYLSWFCAEDSQAVLEAVWSSLGPEQAVDSIACCTERFLHSPFVKTLVPREGSVADTFYALEFAWDLVFRNTCSITVEHVSDTKLTLQLRNMSEDAFYSQEFLSTFAAIFSGILRSTGGESQVVITQVDSETRCVDYAVSWKDLHSTKD
jgi:hypothetical protein